MSRPAAIRLNGDPTEVPEGQPVLELLGGLGVEVAGVVVEINRRVLRAPDLAGVTLHDGDEVEVVRFVGGGW